MSAKFPILVLIAAGTLTVATVRAQDPPADKTSNDGVFTEAQSKRGGELYQQQCASCHDAQLVGTGMAPALTGSDFSANWKGETVASFFERVRATMPADNPGSLSRTQTADIVAFILGFNKAPAGATELAGDFEALKGIKIAPAK